MLTFIIVWVLFSFFSIPAKLYKKHLKNEIQKVDSSVEESYIREKVFFANMITIIVFCFFCIALPYFLFYDGSISLYDFYLTKNRGESMSVLGGIIAALFVFFYNSNSDFTRKLSSDNILNVPDEFILYLRGFINDNYSSKSIGTNFSEYDLVKKCQSVLPFVAVGMSKEIESPYGCQRIYFDDDEWQDGVKELMIKSEAIVILVEDRESCIWEIQQSKSMLNKTIFCVTDKQKYDIVRSDVKDLIDFPEVERIDKNKTLCITYEDNSFIQQEYEILNDSIYNGVKRKLLNICDFPIGLNGLSKIIIYITWMFDALMGLCSFMLMSMNNIVYGVLLLFYALIHAYSMYLLYDIQYKGLYIAGVLSVFGAVCGMFLKSSSWGLPLFIIGVYVCFLFSLYIKHNGVSGWEAFRMFNKTN